MTENDTPAEGAQQTDDTHESAINQLYGKTGRVVCQDCGDKFWTTIRRSPSGPAADAYCDSCQVAKPFGGLFVQRFDNDEEILVRTGRNAEPDLRADPEATHSVCLACGKIKPHEYIPEGSTRCRQCIEKGISDQYRPVGDGFELTEVSVESWPDDETAGDCHEPNGGVESA